MTAPAAIAGSFADAKIVKTRSVLQLVIELPIEQADAALLALGGVPQPGRERPVAVALLDPNVKGEAPWTPENNTAAPVADKTGAPPITSGPLAAAPIAAPTQPPETTQAPAKQRPAGAASSQDPVVQRAAILCGDRRFQDWLWSLPMSDGRQQYEEMDEWAAREVRHRCGVASRRDLAIDNAARGRFLEIEDEYMVATGQRPWRRPDRRSA